MSEKIIYVCKGSYAGDVQENCFYSAVLSENEYQNLDEYEDKSLLVKYILLSEYEKLQQENKIMREAIEHVNKYSDSDFGWSNFLKEELAKVSR